MCSSPPEAYRKQSEIPAPSYSLTPWWIDWRRNSSYARLVRFEHRARVPYNASWIASSSVVLPAPLTPPEPLLDPEERDLEVEEHLVALTDLPEQVPVVRLERIPILARPGERLPGHLFVDPGEAVVELVLLVQPDPPNFVQLLEADELDL